MRHGLATLYVATLLGGCSLLYNPNNIPAGEIDASVADADPTMLEILDVGPRVLLEGQGEGGSRRAILTLTGHHFVTGARVTLEVPGGENVQITVHDADLEIARTRDVLAVPVTIAVDPARASGDVPLTIAVTQGGTSRTLEGKLSLRNLPELDAPITDTAMLVPLYSRVQISGDYAFDAGEGKPPATLRAVSSIQITGKISANATGRTPGPAGRAGGPGGGAGAGAGGGGAGALVGSMLFSGGGGAGHAASGGNGNNATNGGAAVGVALVTSYAGTYASGGGGGTNGRVGGGGGGTIELTAGGTIETGAVETSGGDGAGGCSAFQSCAGGGAGGVVVVRAGATATLGDLAAAPGAGGTGGGAGGGAGSQGRIRIDAHELVGGTVSVGAMHRGPAYALDTPRTTMDFRQQIFVTGTMGDRFDVVVLNAGGASVHSSELDLSVSATASLGTELGPGYNRVCVFPDGSSLDVAESTTCLEIAYLP